MELLGGNALRPQALAIDEHWPPSAPGGGGEAAGVGRLGLGGDCCGGGGLRITRGGEGTGGGGGLTLGGGDAAVGVGVAGGLAAGGGADGAAGLGVGDAATALQLPSVDVEEATRKMSVPPLGR